MQKKSSENRSRPQDAFSFPCYLMGYPFQSYYPQFDYLFYFSSVSSMINNIRDAVNQNNLTQIPNLVNSMARQHQDSVNTFLRRWNIVPLGFQFNLQTQFIISRPMAISNPWVQASALVQVPRPQEPRPQEPRPQIAQPSQSPEEIPQPQPFQLQQVQPQAPQPREVSSAPLTHAQVNRLLDRRDNAARRSRRYAQQMLEIPISSDSSVQLDVQPVPRQRSRSRNAAQETRLVWRTRSVRLNAAQIRGIGSITYVRGQQVEECSICRDQFQGGDVIADMACRHKFHRLCLVRYFTNRATQNSCCPNCRFSLKDQTYQVRERVPQN